MEPFTSTVSCNLPFLISHWSRFLESTMTKPSKSFWNRPRILKSFWAVIEGTSASDTGSQGKSLVIAYVPLPDFPQTHQRRPPYAAHLCPRHTTVSMQLVFFGFLLTLEIDIWISGGSFENVSIHANNVLVTGGTWVATHTNGNKNSPFYFLR